MNERSEVIRERAESNLSEFLEHGPGLRWSTQSWVLAKGDGDKVLLGGLGGSGMGVMWSTRSGITDETYADAPYDPERRDHFGRTGYSDERDQQIRDIENQARKIAHSASLAVFDEALQRLTDSDEPFTITTVTRYEGRSSSGEQPPPPHDPA